MRQILSTRNSFRDNAAAYREQIADVQSEIEEIVDNARVKKILFADRFHFIFYTGIWFRL